MSQVETIFRYNGAEYEFDFRDAEYSERYEKAIETLEKREKAIPKDGKSSTILKQYCSMIKEFFDVCLGEGAGNAICTERSNMAVCNEAYMSFLDLARTQKNDIMRLKNDQLQRMNREQRRKNGKKGHHGNSQIRHLNVGGNGHEE